MSLDSMGCFVMNFLPRAAHAYILIVILVFSPIVPSHGVELGVFGDVSFVTNDDSDDASSFVLGGLDLYGAQNITDNTMAFIEVVFEEDGNSFVVDVERLWIKRSFSNAFQLGAGRFHAPLGYWNRNFHHGVLIQDTPSRPAFLDFEDGDSATLPLHMVGLMATGEIGTALSYELGVANSTAVKTSRPIDEREILIANTNDTTDDKSFFGRMTYDISRIPLQLGLFAMSNKLHDHDGGTVAKGGDIATTSVFGLDLRFEKNAFDALAEYYYYDNQDETGGIAGDDGDADAFYIQLGYRFTEYWKLIYRYEDLSIDDNDSYFNVLGSESYSGNVAALRFDVDETNAITLEVNKKSFDISDDVTEVTLNWAFMMF